VKTIRAGRRRKFDRTIPLPAGVNAGDIKATFENGILEVVVPVPRQRSLRPNVKVEIANASAPQNSPRWGKTPAPFRRQRTSR
jgi:hypothetical protein